MLSPQRSQECEKPRRGTVAEMRGKWEQRCSTPVRGTAGMAARADSTGRRRASDTTQSSSGWRFSAVEAKVGASQSVMNAQIECRASLPIMRPLGLEMDDKE